MLLLNQVLGAIGRDVKVPPAADGRAPSYKETLALVEAMDAGSVGVLLVHDANPVYSLPAVGGLRRRRSRRWSSW